MARIQRSRSLITAEMPDSPAMVYEPDPSPPSDDIQVDLGVGNGDAPPLSYEMQNGVVSPVEDGRDPGVDDPSGHHANLALDIDDTELSRIGDEIVALVEQDIEDRRPWRDKFERGLEMLGLVESDIDDGPFPGASNAVHPLLVEAVTQFWARALGELFPPEGPVQIKVMGAQTQQSARRAERVREFMNWDMTVRDQGYVNETSRLMWALPFMGSAFRKTWRDPVYDENVGVYVPAEDLIMPSEATSIHTTVRFAHRMRKSHNDVLRLQLVGHYRRCDLDAPPSSDDTELDSVKLEASDATDSGSMMTGDDEPHELFETFIEYDVPGHENVDETTGEPTGLKLPYIVTVDRHSRKVLSIYRAWDEGDLRMKRKIAFNQYNFVPGLGAYGYGFFHLIGGLQIAATGALRVLLDSAASASLSGGFIAKNANLKGKDLVSSPGRWQPVDASVEDLSKAFFPLPVKEPSPALFQLLGFLTQYAQKFAATTELMTGDKDPKGAPVGSTVALIEQGQKVMSAIHRMFHAELGHELRLRYDLCAINVPSDGYPYDVAGEERTVYHDDFASGMQVRPVSDPNIFSSQQRIAIGQTVYQISMESGVIPIKKAVQRLLEAMKVPDVDELIAPDVEPQPYDPAGEIQAVLLGKAVRVMPEQPHAEHLQVLAAFMANPEFGANEAVAKQIGPVLISVIAQHLAYAFATGARQMGVPVGYMDPMSGRLMQPGQQPQEGPQTGAGGPGAMPAPMMPPEQIAAMLAQIAPALQGIPGLPSINGADGAGKEAEKEKAQVEIQTRQADMAMKREGHALKLQMQQQEMEHKVQVGQMELQMKLQERDLKGQLAQQKASIDAQAAQAKGQMDMHTAQQDMALKSEQAQMQAQMQASDMAGKQEMQARQMEMEQQAGQHRMALEGDKAEHGKRIKEYQASKPQKLDALRAPGDQIDGQGNG